MHYLCLSLLKIYIFLKGHKNLTKFPSCEQCKNQIGRFSSILVAFLEKLIF